MILYEVQSGQGDRAYLGESMAEAGGVLHDLINDGDEQAYMSKFSVRATKQNLINAIGGWGGYADDVWNFEDGKWILQ